MRLIAASSRVDLQAACFEGRVEVQERPSSVEQRKAMKRVIDSKLSSASTTAEMTGVRDVPLVEAMLDVAETLWWLCRANCRQHMGVDLARCPR